MRVGIVGYGAMGKILESCLKERGVEIGAIVDPVEKAATHSRIDAASMANVDVCICFTSPEAAFDNLRDVSANGRQAVMATTGWLDRLEEARRVLAEHGTGMIYSSNFSLGVNLFFKLTETAARLFNEFSEYDLLGYEMHHRRKKDAPSGTAKTLEKIVLENFTRKTGVEEGRPEGSMKEEIFHFASIRGGDVPGTHALNFESEFDSIELKHVARNRKGFALGSILAARWILGKKGVFTEATLMNELLAKALGEGE